MVFNGIAEIITLSIIQYFNILSIESIKFKLYLFLICSIPKVGIKKFNAVSPIALCNLTYVLASVSLYSDSRMKLYFFLFS